MSIVLKILHSNKYIWQVFGNDRDPYPPDWYKISSPQYWRDFLWFFIRNPLHNFMFLIVGLEGKEFKRYRWYDIGWIEWKEGFFVFQPIDGLLKSKLIYNNRSYLFYSYRKIWNSKREFQFYIGWRPVEGAFGCKLRPFTKRNR